MRISATPSSTDPVPPNPVQSAPPTGQVGGASSPSTPEFSAPASPSSSETGASGSAAHSPGGPAGVSSGGGGAATTAAEAEMLVGSYTTTVSGTHYAGSVEEENGAYVASVPHVTGATVTGATMMDAENNLTIRIDELV